jgi:hypothetical protein
MTQISSLNLQFGGKIVLFYHAKSRLKNSQLAKPLVRYPLLALFAFSFTLSTPHPAEAAVFKGYVDFAQKGFDTLLTGIGLTGLNTFTTAIANAIPLLAIVLVGGWLIWNSYKAMEYFNREEFEGAMKYVIAGVLGLVVVFAMDFILQKIVD